MDLNALIQHAEKAQTQAPLNERLIDIYSGNLNVYVKAAIAEELSTDSFRIASKRIPSINLLERITKKLSKVYTDSPRRTVPDPKDQETLDTYATSTEIQAVMAQAETLLNLNKNFALEPYVNAEGLFSVRVLAPHEFTVYSDDEVDPKNPTHFIKFMGSIAKGKKTANLYWVYSKDLFVAVDSDGDVHDTKENPYGVLPFVYCSADTFRLQPKPDTDSFDNVILIPKLLCDLNFAAQFQSHSIMYGIDVDAKNLQGGPDSFWSVKSEEGTDKKPQLGVLSPSVDVDKVLSLITFTLSAWLESKGIKPGSSGNVSNNSPESAVSKLVDEADTSQVVANNRTMLTKAEKALWKLIGVMHNALVGSERLKIQTGVSNPLHVSIAWAIQKPVTDPQEKRDELKFQLENKLTSYDRALKQAHPDLTDEEIQKLKAEIEQENKQEPIKQETPQ
jgi:hypothetical protein